MDGMATYEIDSWWDNWQNKVRMVCPKCGYEYYYLGDIHEFERCPICGYQAKFEEFAK